MSKLHAIILGAPGSGKGTISHKIVETFKVQHISSGNIFRNHIVKKTTIGCIVEGYIKSGKLVPDDVVDTVMAQELKSKYLENWLLDGYPRTKSQCVQLSTITKINCCINLNVPFDVIIDRLKRRWTHLPSGRVYNIGYNDPKVAGKDDITGEKLVQRDDDKPEAVSKRLQIYKETCLPVIEYYENEGVFKDFEGSASDILWPPIKSYLSSLCEWDS